MAQGQPRERGLAQWVTWNSLLLLNSHILGLSKNVYSFSFEFSAFYGLTFSDPTFLSTDLRKLPGIHFSEIRAQKNPIFFSDHSSEKPSTLT